MQDPLNPSNQDQQSTGFEPVAPQQPQQMPEAMPQQQPQQFSEPVQSQAPPLTPQQPSFNTPQEAQTPQSYPQPQNLTPPAAPAGGKKSNKTLIILLAVGGIVLLGGVAAALFFSGAFAKFTHQSDSGTNTSNVKTGEGLSEDSTASNPSTEEGGTSTAVDQKLAQSVETGLVKSGASDAKVTATQQSKTSVTLTIEVTEAPITMTTLRAALTRVTNALPGPQTATLTFKTSNANLPQPIERIGLGSALIGTATNDTATFDVAKTRDILSR